MSENGSGAEWANSEALETAIGELRETEEECPGVWYVSTYGGGKQAGREFYVVARDAESIPDEAKTYGTDIPGYSYPTLEYLSIAATNASSKES